ncbi:hypothetical protein ACLOJK_010806 [Asimina triloba]
MTHPGTCYEYPTPSVPMIGFKSESFGFPRPMELRGRTPSSGISSGHSCLKRKWLPCSDVIPGFVAPGDLWISCREDEAEEIKPSYKHYLCFTSGWQQAFHQDTKVD